MNKEDYLFTKYIQLYYDNTFLNKIIEKYEKGISLIERKMVMDYILTIDKPENPEELLFIYILFKRTRPNTYVDELGKSIAKSINKSTKELEESYGTLKNILNELGIQPMDISKQVVTNIKHYQEYLRI